MQIISFPSHYQLVYISFDISSFSLISYIAINIGLRRKGTTLTALKRVLHDVINVYTHMYKWQVTLKRYNTYSVVPCTPYANPG